jgi:hypothetical protein
MKTIRNFLNGVSIGLASVMLMSSASLALDNTNKAINEDSLSTTDIVDDILFEEDCSSCGYITIYDTDDNLVYDVLVRDKDNIKDKKLKKLLKRSDYLMSNRISDYYIISN